jgi:hypothetical protein
MTYAIAINMQKITVKANDVDCCGHAVQAPLSVLA